MLLLPFQIAMAHNILKVIDNDRRTIGYPIKVSPVNVFHALSNTLLHFVLRD